MAQTDPNPPSEDMFAAARTAELVDQVQRLTERCVALHANLIHAQAQVADMEKKLEAATAAAEDAATEGA